jgi:hypothetical protein
VVCLVAADSPDGSRLLGTYILFCQVSVSVPLYFVTSYVALLLVLQFCPWLNLPLRGLYVQALLPEI